MDRFGRFFSNAADGVKKLFGSWLAPVTYLGWNTLKSWNKKILISQFRGYQFTAISAIAQEAAKVNFLVTKNDKEIDHELLDLLKNPNSFQSQFQFLEYHFVFMNLVGESYWYMPLGETSKKPKVLYIIRPDLITPVIDKESNVGAIKNYKLNKPDGSHETLEINEVLHFQKPNPEDQNSGLGPVEAGKDYVETENFATNFTKHSFYNAGRPSGILNIKGNVDKIQKEQIKKMLKQEYLGIKNAGKTLLLTGGQGIDYQKLGMELGEIGLRDMKEMTRDDIMVMFRMSKTILGITDDVNRANSEEMRAVFLENIVKPELDRFVDHLNSFLMPRFGSGAVLEYDDPVQMLFEQKLKMVETGNTTYSMTINEKRDILGLDPVDGGDVIYAPINYVPITTPPKKSLKKKVLKVVKAVKDPLEQFDKLVSATRGIYTDLYDGFWNKEFNKQLKEILNKNKDLSKTELKNIFTEWIFNVDASTSRIIGFMLPSGVELIKAVAAIALDLAQDPDTEFQITDRMNRYISERADRLAEATSDETIKKIEETIAQGVSAGDSIAELKKRIIAVYSTSEERAIRIARTEVLATSNEGVLEAYRQSPLVKAKRWVAAGPDPCEFCRAMDGKEFPLNDNFASKGEDFEGTDGGSLKISYENIVHPPLHPNCECRLIPVR